MRVNQIILLAIFTVIFTIGCGGTLPKKNAIYKVYKMEIDSGPTHSYYYVMANKKQVRELKNVTKNEKDAINQLLNDSSLENIRGYVSSGYTSPTPYIRLYYSNERRVGAFAEIKLKNYDVYQVKEGSRVVYPPKKIIEPIKNNKGLIDSLGNVILKAEYETFKHLSNGNYLIVKDKKFGLLSAQKEIIIPADYEWLSNFSDGLAIISVDGKKGFINKKNNIVIKPQYNDATKFVDGVAGVQQGEKWYLINKEGQKVISKNFYKIGKIRFSEIIPVIYNAKNKDKWNFINANGQPLPYVGTKYSYAQKGKYIYIRTLKGTLLLNKQGKLIFPYKFPSITALGGDRYCILNHAKCGVIDGKMKVIIPFDYDFIGSFKDDNVIVIKKIDGIRYKGVMNIEGKIIVPIKYNYIEAYAKDTYRLVEHRNYSLGETAIFFYDLKSGKINPSLQKGSLGKQITSKKKNRYHIVAVNRKYGVADKQNNIIIPLKNKLILPSYNQMFIVKDMKNRFGVLNSQNREVLPFEYDSIVPFKGLKGAFVCNKKGKSGVVNMANKVVIPFKYEKIVYSKGQYYTYCKKNDKCD